LVVQRAYRSADQVCLVARGNEYRDVVEIVGRGGIGIEPLAQARRNSPLHLAPGAAPCPVAVAVGANETAAFHEHSRAYADKLGAAGWPCQLVIQPGMHHFEIVMSLTRPDDALVGILREQMSLAGAPA
jgi:acetyl esterase/lipase